MELENDAEIVKLEAALREVKVSEAEIGKLIARLRKNENGVIRFGLAGIRGVGVKVAQHIVSERETRGVYKDFNDFCARNAVVLDRSNLGALIKSGALDFTNEARAFMFAQIPAALALCKQINKEKTNRQRGLFG
jgi:DNA polymerase-3 subunit alpha